MDGLRAKYGRLTPQEKEANERRMNLPWSVSKPIEDLFDQLEECYIVVLIAKPLYTKEQMID